MQPQCSTSSGIRPALITVDELAKLLNISVRHLHRLKSRGDIIPAMKIGKLPRWSLEDIDLWIKQGCPSPRKVSQTGGR